MKGRSFSITLWQDKDGVIRECSLNKKDKYGDAQVLGFLSKREVEYLIWVLADARTDMEYSKDEPQLYEDLEVNELRVKVDKDFTLKGCPPPTCFK